MTPRSPWMELGDSVTRSVERMAAEHEARGLLNFIELTGRLLAAGVEPEADAAQWRREAEAARALLERLYEAGLPRDFLGGRW